MASVEKAFVVNNQYKDILIFHKPKLTLAGLIQFVASYSSKQRILRTFNEWHNFKVSYLFGIYMQIYLREKITRECKYDILIDKYYDNIPSMTDISTNFRPYLTHIVNQINVENDSNVLSKMDLRNNFHIYMNKRCVGPIQTLSMTKKDLLVFGYIHKFRDQYQFYSQIIPWDVIKLIHLFFDKVNKKYLDKFENIKQKIVEIEEEIYDLKSKKNSHFKNNIINSKQNELLTLYKKTNDITIQEEYYPHLVDEYLIDKKQYKLKSKDFIKKLSIIPFELFENEYEINCGNDHGYSGINIKRLLFSLLKNQIMKQNFLFMTKHKILADQLNIYSQYVLRKWTHNVNAFRLHGSRSLHKNLTQWTLEIFDKDNNEWIKLAEKTVRLNSRIIQNQYKISRDSSFNFNAFGPFGIQSKNRIKPRREIKTGYSFTVD